MLLESALTELSIDLNQQQIYVDNVVLEMCSPSESLSDQRTPSSKEQVSLPLAEDRHSYGTPGSVPFGWEIQPGIPKKETTEIEIRDQVVRSPLRLPPSAYSSPSPNRHSQDYLTWNVSPGRRHLALAASAHRQSVVAEYDGDDESVGGEFDSNEGCSPVSTLGRMSLSPNKNSPSHCYNIDGLQLSGSAANLVVEDSVPGQNSGELVTEAAASSAAKSCATLLWGVFPCSSKCFFQQKEKNKPNGSQAAGLSKANSAPSSDLMVFDAVHEDPTRPVASALKKKRRKSSWAGLKQVRFSVEDAGNRNGGAPAGPDELQWASYGLF